MFTPRRFENVRERRTYVGHGTQLARRFVKWAVHAGRDRERIQPHLRMDLDLVTMARYRIFFFSFKEIPQAKLDLHTSHNSGHRGRASGLNVRVSRRTRTQRCLPHFQQLTPFSGSQHAAVTSLTTTSGKEGHPAMGKVLRRQAAIDHRYIQSP